MDDVGYCDTQARNHQGQRPGWHRYRFPGGPGRDPHGAHREPDRALQDPREGQPFAARPLDDGRSEEHTSELQSLMRISYAVFCLKKKKKKKHKSNKIKKKVTNALSRQ